METEEIERRIYPIRGRRVMLDSDLADVYGVPTKYLGRQVHRNQERFPDDFMFQLTPSENRSLRCQIGTLKRGRHAKYLPRVFTEHGVAMLSSVLRSSRAIQANIEIMRAFIKLRRCLASSPSLTERMRQVESRLSGHDSSLNEHAQAIREVFADIRRLMEPAVKRARSPRRRRGEVMRVVATVRR